MTSSSVHDGALDTSTTTSTPAIASARPSPVTLLTPELGEAATASCPSSVRFATTCDPISPVPPITKIFIAPPFKISR